MTQDILHTTNYFLFCKSRQVGNGCSIMRLLTFMMISPTQIFFDYILGRNFLLREKESLGGYASSLILMWLLRIEDREVQTSLSSFYFVILSFSTPLPLPFPLLKGIFLRSKKFFDFWVCI